MVPALNCSEGGHELHVWRTVQPSTTASYSHFGSCAGNCAYALGATTGISLPPELKPVAPWCVSTGVALPEPQPTTTNNQHRHGRRSMCDGCSLQIHCPSRTERPIVANCGRCASSTNLPIRPSRDASQDLERGVGRDAFDPESTRCNEGDRADRRCIDHVDHLHLR
jgi:hypothetical protein